MSLFAALRLKRMHFHHQQLLTINLVAQLGFLTADGCLSHLTYGTWSYNQPLGHYILRLFLSNLTL